MKDSNYEGKQEDIRNMDMPEIEVWTNQYPDRDYEIKLEIPEFTCVCPKTGLPDFAMLVLTYTPDVLCLELKSFKEYIIRFRDIGIFHEHVTNRILDDVVKACQPRKASLIGKFNTRGGIQTTVEAVYAA